jgi:hypothetical protein
VIVNMHGRTTIKKRKITVSSFGDSKREHILSTYT